MRLPELARLVSSTRDPSFATDGQGLVVAWNAGAEELFGRKAGEVLGVPCGQVLEGADECGAVCSEDCSVRRRVAHGHPVGNFDLQVQTSSGRRWCNVSVLAAHDPSAELPYAIYVLRPVDVSKRLETLVRDFIVSETGLGEEQAAALLRSSRPPARAAELTESEANVLRLLARGAKTAEVASSLNISRTTVNNHVQHILRKLGAHTRLEAIRRAERAGLI